MAKTDPEQELRENEGRPPPYDLTIEAMVLSELLVDDGAFDRVAGILGAEKFWSHANRRIYECVETLRMAGKLVDAASVASLAQERGWLDQIGGTPYITQIATATPAPGPYLEQHAERVRELWRRRRAIALAQMVIAEGYGDVGGDGQSWIEGIEQQYSVLAHEHSRSELVPVGVTSVRELGRIAEGMYRGTLSGISTGFPKLDHITSGLHPGDLYIFAGRPGMGKTAFLLSLLLNISSPRFDENGTELPRLGTALFSLEQPKEQIALRALCGIAGASFTRLRNNHFHQDDLTKLDRATERIQSYPLYVDDKAAITLMEIRAQVRKLKRRFENGTAEVRAKTLIAVGVDYMQLMEAEKEIRRRGSREQEVSSFANGLKRIAKEEQVVMMALSQLNRSVENRSDKRPQLSDLRESGAIEQDADLVGFLYRDAYYSKSRDDNICELDIAKQRNGPTEMMKLAFDAECMRFRSLTSDEEMSGENMDSPGYNYDGDY